MTERRSGVERRRLSGAQKAAALLIVMERDSAARLLTHLEADDIRAIAHAAASLGVVDRGNVESIIAQFEAELGEGPHFFGGVDEARRLASASLTPKQASGILAELAGGQAVDVWAEVRSAAERQVIGMLEGEPAQFAAVLLDRIDPALAARVCAGLPADARASIMWRMLTMRRVTPAMSRCLESVLAELVDAPEPEAPAAPASARIADILNRLEPEQIDAVLDAFETRDSEEAASVRDRLFRFDDIVKLAHDARARLFDQVPTERVILALHGTDETLRPMIMACLGARARRMVESELSSGQQPPARDIAAAKRAIAEIALKLIESGKIALTAPAADSATQGAST